jgi:hypothetical protein
MPRLQPIKFIRKPFVVEAIQVTPQNMREVSKWCRGQIRNVDGLEVGGDAGKKVKAIKVPVKRPLSERQTLAIVGDWVVAQGSGHKVYTQRAFEGSYERYIEQMMDEVEADARAEQLEVDVTNRLPETPVTPSDLFQTPEPHPV